MDREQVLNVIGEAIQANVQCAGVVRLPVLSESTEQVAIDVLDALESAGFTIVKIEGSPG